MSSRVSTTLQAVRVRWASPVARVRGASLILSGVLALSVAAAGCRPDPSRLSPNAWSAARAKTIQESETDRYWLDAKSVVQKRLHLAEANAERGSRPEKFVRGDRGRKSIALTFDDGPHAAYTPQILQILKQEGVKATFFLVGEMAEKYPALVRAEVADGHSVGNHTYHHLSLVKVPTENVAVEIKACGEVLRSITGKAPHLFRPPGGDCDQWVLESAQALGYTSVFWTDDPGDYASPGADVIEQRLLRSVDNGGIILLHDGIRQTIEILPRLLQTLKARGYDFVTVDEMLRRAPTPEIPKVLPHYDEAQQPLPPRIL